MEDPGSYFRMDGKVAVVTGGASGIGESTAEVLAGAGASVVIGDIDLEGATKTADRITAAGGRALATRTDTSRRSDVEALVDLAVREHGHLDVMANVAGVGHNKPVMELDDDEVDRIFAINLKGVLYGCQAAVRAMTDRGEGSIVNVASTAVDTPYPGQGLYGMTKSSVVFLTQVLAAEVGPLGIRVNAVAPGSTPTNFASFRYDAGKIDPKLEAEVHERLRQMTPLGTLGEAVDQALVILYLCSPAARWATGNVWRVNGGQSRPW